MKLMPLKFGCLKSLFERLNPYYPVIAVRVFKSCALQDKCREHVKVEYYKAKNGSQPVELFRANVASDDKGENDPDFYEGLEPSELLDIGDK